MILTMMELLDCDGLGQEDGTVRLWWVVVPRVMELSGRGGQWSP